jgi:ATP-dependent helicase/nuclease subunit A
LVRSNAQGVALTEALREHGLPAVWAGDKAIADNPAVGAVLDLFRFAEHPGDSAAWQHLLMGPLRNCLGAAPELAADRTVLDVLATVGEQGFATAVEDWLMRLRQVVDLDPFSRQRLRLLLDAAEAFDRSGRRSCLEFVDFVGEYTVSEVVAPGSVQVMTLHRSKGLGFDVVVLPLFPGRNGLDSVHAEGVLAAPLAEAGEGVPWLMLAPPTAVASADPVLHEAMAAASNEAAFGELCLLYVGMTRARWALRILVPPLPKSEAASVHLHTVVRRLLAGESEATADGALAQLGDPRWHEAWPVQPSPSVLPQEPPARPPASPAAPARHRRSVPSAHDERGRDAGDLFLLPHRRGQAFGSALHGLLEQVRWLEDEPLAQVAARWRARARLPRELADAVVVSAARALAVPAIRQEFSRPTQACELWQERSFEMILDNEWVSGTFDRVVLYLGPDGRTRNAVLVDLKSDATASEEDISCAVARYSGQMGLYRKALCRLTGLVPEAVAVHLVFSHAGRVVCLV